MNETEEENVQLIVEELPTPAIPQKDRYKCEVCNMDFYKRWYSPYKNARALESHLKRQAHKHNVERRAQGLEPERIYNLTNANKQLGELVERFGSRLEDLEALIRDQTRRLEGLETGSIRSWMSSSETAPSSVAASEAEEVSQPHQTASLPRPDMVSRYFPDTTRLGPPQLRDWEENSVACSEDTTITDITEEECPPLQRTTSSRGFVPSHIQQQNQRVLELSSEEGSSRVFGRSLLSRSHDFKPTDNETSAVYQYDGNNYAAMVQIGNMLERLMIWVKQNWSGSKLTTNLQYIHRTQSALNLQMRQRLNGEPRDAEDTELLLDRLYTIMEHNWEA